MTRRSRGLPVLLLAFCGMAAAQTSPSATQAHASPQPTSTAHAADAGPGKTAVVAVPTPALSPQQQRLLDGADQLLDLAQKLKAEVDKTDQYTLSLNTLRRANDIGKLAKSLEKQIEHESH